MVSNQREDKIVLQAHRPARGRDYCVVDSDFLDVTVEKSFDLSVLDAILEVGLDPVLYVMVELRTAVNQRNPSTMPPKIKRRDGCRVLAADHQHIRVVVGVRLPIIVGDFGEILTGNAKLVREIVVAGRYD